MSKEFTSRDEQPNRRSDGVRALCGHHSVSSRRAFSLTEVMFAVIVLGIGFILLAAMFPVAISQSRLTVDETTGAAIARSAMALSSRTAENGDSPPILPAPPAWGPLLPPTDLLVSPPASGGGVPPNVAVPPGEQITIPGKVLSFNDLRLDNATLGPVDYRANLWNAFKGSFVVPSDPRYAWVPFYRRDVTYVNTSSATQIVPDDIPNMLSIRAPFAQIYFVPVAVRNRSTYDGSVASPDLTAATGNLVPRSVQIQIAYSPRADGYVIAFMTAGGNVASVVEGAFVIVSDDQINSPAPMIGTMNGRAFRVGNRRADLDDGAAGTVVWELAPGGSFVIDPGPDGVLAHLPDGTPNPAVPVANGADDVVALGNTTPVAGSSSTVTSVGPATAFIIGRNTTAVAGEFEGVAQDVSAFVTFIKVN